MFAISSDSWFTITLRRPVKSSPVVGSYGGKQRGQVKEMWFAGCIGKLTKSIVLTDV